MTLYRQYISLIKYVQTIVSVLSVLLFLFIMPMIINFAPGLLSQDFQANLYALSLFAVTFVMAIRPLADIFGWVWLRNLVILRKSFGILSASIIIGFALVQVLQQGNEYFLRILTPEYWEIINGAYLAHIGDVTAAILLITSNTFSRRSLGKWWKRIQKLAYVYFYSGALYVVVIFQEMYALIALVLVSVLLIIAYVKKRLL